MASYRLFVLDANDRFVGVQNVFYPDNSEAMAAARAVAAARGLFGGRSAVEVWAEGRRVGRADAANRSLKPVVPENGQVPRVAKHRWTEETKSALKPSQAMSDAEMHAADTRGRGAPNPGVTQLGSYYAGHDPREEHPDAVTLRRISR